MSHLAQRDGPGRRRRRVVIPTYLRGLPTMIPDFVIVVFQS